MTVFILTYCDTEDGHEIINVYSNSSAAEEARDEAIRQDTIVPIPGTRWQVVVGKDQFKVGDSAIYIEPDYVVNTSSAEFSFLDKKGAGGMHRLRAIRLRGELSFGLLIPLPATMADKVPGDDVMEELQITRYSPPEKYNLSQPDGMAHDSLPSYFSVIPKFDIESLSNFPGYLTTGEEVVVTEKIHGANARYIYDAEKDEFFMGSRNRWLKRESSHAWSAAATACPWIEKWCRENHGVVLFGEVFGNVQSLKYGRPGSVDFLAFAAYDTTSGVYVDTPHLHSSPLLSTVPVLYRGPWDVLTATELAEGDSTVPGATRGHMREGVVIVPVAERHDSNVGRVIFKHISNRYWLSSNE